MTVVGHATNFNAITEQIAGKLDEGLNMQNISATGDFFMKGARFQARNALFFSWMALPEPRRTRAEAERMVRLAISGQLALIEAIDKSSSLDRCASRHLSISTKRGSDKNISRAWISCCICLNHRLLYPLN